MKAMMDSTDQIKYLNSNGDSGLTAKQVDENRAQQGINDRMVFESTPCIEFILEPASDPMIIILMVAAVVAIIIGLVKEHGHAEGALEGVSILIAIFVVVITAAQNDYNKEQEFLKLQEVQSNSQKQFVLRAGKEEEIEFEDIVAGDVLKLNQGTQVPVDALVLRFSGSKLKVDESSVTGETDLIVKCTVYDVQAGTSGDAELEPNARFALLVSGSVINEGTAQALVVSVGENTYIRRQAKLDNDVESPLQEKLSIIAEQIGYFGLSTACLIILIIWIKVSVQVQQQKLFPNVDELIIGLKQLDAIIVGIAVIVCAIPEGLPLAVTICLAQSVSKMMQDNCLVKKINSCETMGNANCICTDKTGTLTENLMSIQEVWSNNVVFAGNKAKDYPFQTFFRRTVFSDCAVNFRMNDKTNSLECIGSKTEVACINLWVELVGKRNAEQFDQTSLNNQFDTRITSDDLFKDEFEFLAQWPFNSQQKMSCSLLKKGSEQILMLKGAPDYLIKPGMSQLANGGAQSLDQTVQDNIIAQLNRWSDSCFRNIALCQQTVDFDPQVNGELVKNPFDLVNPTKYVLQGMIAIKDPLRSSVKQAISQCQSAGITVRMVTGDNDQTAFAIAKDCGILPSDTQKSEMVKFVINGTQFEQLSGGTREVQFGMKSGGLEGADQYSISEIDDAIIEKSRQEAVRQMKEGVSLKKKYFVKNLKWFEENIDRLRVMARSQPMDKFTMVTGLMQLGNIVAVTGDGANDASALSKSHVGFAMGIAGTQAAKEASDIIIMDDNFASIVKAVLWGRNIFDGVRKFLSFQLSVNVVAVFTTLISSAFDDSNQSTLTAVQLLWVNMIMDSLGALALATDVPTDKLLMRKPQSRQERIINKRILVNVGIMGTVQTCVMCIFLQAGHLFIKCGYTPGTQNQDMFCTSTGMIKPNSQVQTHPLQKDTLYYNSPHYSIIFNVFIFMQIYNMLQCRKIDENFNFFEGIHKNFVFIGIQVFMIVVQMLLGNQGGAFFSIHKDGLSGDHWMVVLLFALVVFPVNIFSKWLVFQVFKLGDGEDELDPEEDNEEEEEEHK